MKTAVLMLSLLVAPLPALGTSAPQELPDLPPPARDYEPNADHPFGRPNPAAPEVEDFSFLIGEFDCIEERLLPDKSYARSRTLWRGKYILNGQAVQDSYFGTNAAATSIRFFDSQKKKWLVNFQAKPGNVFGYVWSGGKQGDRVVLTTTYPNEKNETILSRLTFSDITDSGFEWLSEEINQTTGVRVVDWRISARRRGGEPEKLQPNENPAPAASSEG